MEPRIRDLGAIKLVGIYEEMSLTEDKTFKLFNTFMPRRNEVINAVSKSVLDLRIYDKDYFVNFAPNKPFIKWAALEVLSYEIVPSDMYTLDILDGLYASFSNRGFKDANSFFEYIYTLWIPNSKYELDDRPHFELLNEDYRNNPDSNQASWIPVKLKE